MESTYFSLASKENFNKALRHFFKVTDIVDEVESKQNIADVINQGLDEGEVNSDQVLPIIGAIIRDKFGYSFDSYNVPKTIADTDEFNKITEVTVKWTALDILLVYYNSSGTVYAINPKNINHWERIRELHHDQLVVIYVKDLKEEDKNTEIKAIESIKEMLLGKDVFVDKKFIDATVVVKKPVVEKPAPSAGSKKKSITPKYAVRVSNELFHNGNVEAWKKIIESYNTKFPELEVYIFHEGELINDINSLFKWGKVKHGDSIFFQVAGEEIKGVSKLKKYLFEGASHRYEQFLNIAVGQVLNLF